MAKRTREPLVLRILREQNGLTQTRLAADIGVNQVDISLQENSRTRQIPNHKFNRIAEILDVSNPDDLLLTYREYILKNQA